MRVFKQVEAWRAYLMQLRSAGSSVGLVPTMGALHQGHLRLIAKSREENQVTVCSIFVNPAQFNNPNDLKNYPRPMEHDLELLQSQQCDVAFCPDASEMYPEDRTVSVSIANLDSILEGKFRPGHFNGVALVVSKLFHLIDPDRAYFGQKDYQQWMIVSRLVSELNFRVQLRSVPIFREPDGLAMSSRNQLLAEGERKNATVLYESLRTVRDGLVKGAAFSELHQSAIERCSEKNVKLDYLVLADRQSLALKDRSENPRQEILLIAGYAGNVRLIDNLFMTES